MPLNAFLYRPPIDRPQRLSALAASTPAYNKHKRYRNQHTLFRRSGVEAAKALDVICQAIIGRRYAATAKQTSTAPTSKEHVILSKQRAVHGENGGIVSPTGAILSSLFPRTAALLAVAKRADAFDPITSKALSPPAGHHGRATLEVLALSLGTRVYSLLQYVGFTNLEAVVSLTETTTFLSTSPYSGNITQAAVPPTGTTSLFCPPPPPEPEPYITGQTQ